MTNQRNEAANLVNEAVQENFAKIKSKKDIPAEMRMNAGVIGIGAGGGNIAHLMTPYGYDTAAFNTTPSDMVGLNVGAKVVMKGINGSGKDRAFSATQFKQSYKSFFEHDKIKQLLENDLIFVVGTGGGGTGTIISVMTAGYLKNEYPDKTIFVIGLLGSVKEDLVSQRNILEFMSDLENKTNCPYLLFDNNRVKDRVGDDVYDVVNQDVVNAIRILSKEYFVENNRSNIDGRDYARLTSFSGLTSVIAINDLNRSVVDEKIDLKARFKDAINKSTNVVTEDPDAYGFFMNTSQEVYSRIDITFDEFQLFGVPRSGLAFRHLQNTQGEGPEFAVIMTGMAAPLGRFNLIERRIEELEKVKEKAKLPSVDRGGSSLDLAGDGKRADVGKGTSFLDSF